MKLEGRRRTFIVLAGTVVLALVGAVYAVAGHGTGAVPSYTGCLTVSTGKLNKFKEGDSPKTPCGSAQTQVHVSGGDLTGLTAGFGLLGGGEQGQVALGVDTSVVQSRVSAECAPGSAIRVVEASGNVICQATISDYTVVQRESAFDSQDEKSLAISCPAGLRVLGGGGGADRAGMFVNWSGPFGDQTWAIRAYESPPTDNSWRLYGTAICARTE